MNARAKDTSVSEHEVVVDGVRSPLLRAGAPAREAVVFVHGNPGSREDWRAMVERVGAFAYAAALDMPAFGRADRPRDFAYTVDGYAAHLHGALRELGVERAHLVLHDFGGPWGLTWAAQHPQQLASVSLVNTGVLLDYRWHKLARIWRTPLLGELLMLAMKRGDPDAFARGLNAGQKRALPKAFTDRMVADIDDGTRRAILKLYRASGDVAGMSARQAEVLRPLDVDALVVWGKNDAYIPVAQAEKQRSVFPRAIVRILDDSGHWPMGDDPDGVADALIPFLRAQFASALAAE
ncbi:MAG TPA: alpha/beta hydrolase [Myxococcota bacterium]|jgi:pimeloyl-ACP methyl ester carboxylesterase